MRRHDPDYIDRTIETVRNHRDADNCWPQWANIFADDIEDLRDELEAAGEEIERLGETVEYHIRTKETIRQEVARHG